MIGIKDMKEMPKSCSECMVRHECKVADEWDEFDWNYNERCDGCSLVEIGTCKECKYSSVHTISLDKIDEIRVCRIQFSKQIKDDYYCANYEKRGNENEIN